MTPGEQSLDKTTLKIISDEILTEHLGYQPVEMLDDIINVINLVMYKCVDQVQKILTDRKFKMDEEDKKSKRSRLKRKHTAIDEYDDDDDDVIMNEEIAASKEINNKQKEKCSVEDIEKGTASFETFFEHHISQKSDIIESFAYTTIFSIPPALVSKGVIRLKHHEGLCLDKDALAQRNELREEYDMIWKEIETELHFNKVLSESIVKFRKMLKFSKQLREKVNLEHLTHMPKIDALHPLRETYRYLIVELSSAYETLINVRPQLKDEKLLLM
ncbi:unnamed protein product [Ambrosiozyma monospora]|uniref:Unnamed protein product n=1 Tax=Ambrosiozyma monospora TaxID=43982 RepID=A0ACB5T0I2_AMBMO|nr:unnamed protein product [Ambrosiozyma monospora]